VETYLEIARRFMAERDLDLPQRISWTCMRCGSHDYWHFSEAAGEGRACISCHILPPTLAYEWEAEHGRNGDGVRQMGCVASGFGQY
jgi:hypothetical protein